MLYSFPRFALLIGFCFVTATVNAQDSYAGISSGTATAQGTSVRYGTASAVVDFPMEQVEEMVHDYATFHEYLPHFQTSRVLSQRGHRALVYVEVSAIHGTVTLWAQTRISSRIDDDGRRVVEGRMTEGNLDHFTARWELRRVDDGRTQIRFRLLADPDLPVPSSIITEENQKMARRVVRAMRERLQAG